MTRPDDAPAAGVLERVLVALEGSLEDMTDVVCARIYDELDSYEAIAPEALHSAMVRNLGTALAALRADRVPDPAELDGADQTAHERFASGIPVEEIVRAFRIGFAQIHEGFVDLAMSLGLPVDRTVRGSRVLWQVADAFTTRIITSYHALEVGSAVRQAELRETAVRALLSGEAPSVTALAGIDPRARYAVVRCAYAEGTDPEPVRALLETSGSTTTAAAVVVATGGVCIGLVARRPGDPGVPAGLGAFVPLADLPASARQARECQDAATRLRRTGVHTVEDLGWRLAAASQERIGALYRARFLDPLAAEGTFGREIQAALRAYLANGRSVARTAQALTVHQNTVRYRLARFTILTGCDLDDLDDLVGVAWALELAPGEP